MLRSVSLIRQASVPRCDAELPRSGSLSFVWAEVSGYHPGTHLPLTGSVRNQCRVNRASIPSKEALLARAMVKSGGLTHKFSITFDNSPMQIVCVSPVTDPHEENQNSKNVGELADELRRSTARYMWWE